MVLTRLIGKSTYRIVVAYDDSQVKFSGFHKEIKDVCKQLPGALQRETGGWNQDWLFPLDQEDAVCQALENMQVRRGWREKVSQRSLKSDCFRPIGGQAEHSCNKNTFAV